MEVAELPAFVLTNNEPLQQQIHSQLVQWVSQGRLTPGIRLPATRKLSEMLGVSRNTVSAVFDQLRAEGFIESQVGRGNFIAADLPVMSVESQGQTKQNPDRWPPLSSFGTSMAQLDARHHDQALPFTPGIPDLVNFPMSIWQKLQRRHQDRQVLMGYCDDQGYEPLREALATYLRVSRGVQCDASQILITQGAQQAISLCSQLLLNDHDSVLHENPGYRGAGSAFLVREPNMIHVPLKDSVIDVDWLIEHSAENKHAKLLYTCPTHQYPMGGLLSASQRLALLSWAHEHDVWIIEDDYDSEFHFQHKPVAAMQGVTANNNVLYMGSFSKTLFPSLRLGYLVLPKHLVGPFTAAKSFATGESPLFAQAVIADFIQEGHFVRHLRRMRQLYKEKWKHFERCIQTTLAGKVNTIAESAGMHLVLEIPQVDDVKLKQTLHKAGYGSSALSSYYLTKAEKTGLVMGFANTTEAQRLAVVKVLDSLL